MVEHDVAGLQTARLDLIGLELPASIDNGIQ
jgi:hypothetical protein